MAVVPLMGMGGSSSLTLRAPTSFHRRYPSLPFRLLSLAHSLKHFSSSLSLDPSSKPSPSPESPNPTKPQSKSKSKPKLNTTTSSKSSFSPPYSTVPSHRHSIEHLPGNPTKPPSKPTTKPFKKSKPLPSKPRRTDLPAMDADAGIAPPAPPAPAADGGGGKEKVVGVSVKKQREAYRKSPAGLLQQSLDQCSKQGATVRALELYDSAVSAGLHITLRNYNCLLYLCSLPSSSDATTQSPDIASGDPEAKFNDPEVSKMAVERGFEIYRRMCEDPMVEPNEATLTSMARLAAAKGDPHLAFDLVKQMEQRGMPPKLRSYWPALHGFCDALDVEMAHQVETHMDARGIVPEDADLAALLRAYATKGRANHVYRLLHKMRTIVRQVSEPAAEYIQSWFQSDAAAAVGASEWDTDKIKQGVVKGGGGWHGQGWLGTGRWRVERTTMSESGVCKCCGEKLISIDINPLQTEAFAWSLIELPYFKKNKEEFVRFERWLQKSGPYDAVIDAANVGLCNQKKFNFSQVNSVINQIKEISPSKKMPLVILHERRGHDETAKQPRNREIIGSWKKAGCLYLTPRGSNDDWYWLYAAVSNKCLLVTNDEMRDHLFQLLGTSFFPRWKEKHQVRMTFSRKGLTLHMPPPYSIVIQESENGIWHIPTTTGDDLETPRQWICVTRDTANGAASVTTSAASSADKMQGPTQPVQRLSQMGW